MRVVLDTNIFVSALMVETSLPAKLVGLWRVGKFTLLSAREQIDELFKVTRYPKIRERITPALAGRLINEIRDMAILVDRLPRIEVSNDPYDDYLLAIAMAGKADYLVTGDKADLLSLGQYAGAKIVSVRDFLTLTQLLP